MAKFKVYKLHFKTPLHLGDERDDYSISLKTIHSDTMYSALISSLAKMGNDIPQDGDLGFTISSLFPFYQENEESNANYFFPKPLKQTMPKLKDISKAKDVKKVLWLDKYYFEKIINGTSLFEDDESINCIKGEYLTEANIEKDFISSQVFPRVTVSRSGQEDAKPFYMEKIFFTDNSGLFFIAQGETNLLEKALNLLQHEGIGTDRNVGNGFFEYTTDEIEINLPKDSVNIMSLSLFIPEDQQQLVKMFEGENVAYDFVRRGGWITTPPYNTYRKNAVYAFLPGSVFNNRSSETHGKIVDLKPEIEHANFSHSIWRNGKAIFIPITSS
ncbi:MAG: type III-A CRISPR-associated RAMP protein Csm4 [Candidatus Carbobacillus sp.]|jgi:CRISPR-associated protein Csm4|nr:type III-A CRISPR-associated RAMP protein Csm4 [Bacteroidales bacterium]MDY0324123.1 type III-A CRISPR-associated RAMP protein Csm4 [Candidatus Carbobacillus sp.]